MLELIARKEAWEKGLTRYFTGQPCRARGHVAERYVSTSGCVECLTMYKGKFSRTGLTKELTAWRPADAIHIPVGLTPRQIEHLRLCMQSWVVNWAEAAGVPLTDVQRDAINTIVQTKLGAVKP